MPIPEQSTIEALQRLSWAKTHRAKCQALSLPSSWRGTIGRILHGHMVGLDKENEVRLRLGLPQRVPTMIEVPPCEDCGDVHTGRCNGKPVAAVVTLAPGETARITNSTKRQRRAYYRPCLSPEVGDVVKERGLDVQRIMENYITDNYLW